MPTGDPWKATVLAAAPKRTSTATACVVILISSCYEGEGRGKGKRGKVVGRLEQRTVKGEIECEDFSVA